MNAILHRLQRLSDDELLRLGKTIDLELDRRLGSIEEATISVHQRAAPVQISSLQSPGSAASQVKFTDIKGTRRRLAA
jgi:hypothetical protein